MNTLICSRCGLPKPGDAFARRPNGQPNGSRCKTCLAELRRVERAARPPKSPPPRDRDRTTKTCNACGVEKPVGEFYWNARRWSSRCRACFRAAQKRDRQADPDKYTVRHRQQYAKHRARARAANRAWRTRNGLRVAENAARRTARLKGAPRVDVVDRAAIIARDRGICYLCGRSPTGWSLTLDHVVALAIGGAHTADNLRVACRSCNASKRTTSAERYHRLQALVLTKPSTCS